MTTTEHDAAVEAVARIINPAVWDDDFPVPTRADTIAFHAARQESCAKAVKIIAALEPRKGE